jgi:hypothetical protein
VRKILITGSRDFFNQKFMEKTFDEHIPEGRVLLIHGQCRGADMTADKIARQRKWWVATCPADWSKGHRAGVIRNEEMPEVFEIDLVLAFPTESSKGTRHMIGIAEALGIKCLVFETETYEELM